MAPLLDVCNLEKIYWRRRFDRAPSFRLSASFTIAEPEIIGMMGPNGSGKTTLFELITGSNAPAAGEVRIAGRNIHRVRTDQRDRLAIHYHQSYQVRRFRSFTPNAFLKPAESDSPLVHLFDEPQFSTQDGYIGFMLDFFRRLRNERRLVFLCLHPNEQFHLEILRDVCKRFIFVDKGSVSLIPDYDALLAHKPARAYLGALLAKGAA